MIKTLKNQEILPSAIFISKLKALKYNSNVKGFDPHS